MKLKPIRIVSAAAAGIVATLVALCFPGSALDSALFDLTLRARATKREGRPGVAYIELDSPADGGLDAKALAEGFELLREFGASALVLDLSQLPEEIDSGAEERRTASLPPLFESEFGRMADNVRSLFEAIRLGSLRPKDSPRFVDELVGMVGQSGSRLLSAALAEDRVDEARLAAAIDGFGPLYAVSPVDEGSASHSGPSLRSMIEEKALKRAPSYLYPDPDGVWRRGRLVGGKSIAEAVAAEIAAAEIAAAEGIGGPPPEPVADIVLAAVAGIGRAEIRVGEGSPLRLEFALEGQDESTVSTIPLDEGGRLVIDWSLRSEDLPRLRWSELNACARLEEELEGALLRMDAAGYLDAETEVRADEAVVAPELVLIERATFQAGAIQEARIVGEYERILASGSLNPAEIAAVADKRDEARAAFSRTRRLLIELIESRDALDGTLRGRLCVAAVARPVARSPLGEEIPVGQARALLAQTLVSGLSAETPFRAVLPRGWVALSAFLLALVAAVACAFLSPGGAVLLGLGLDLVIALGSCLTFAIALQWFEPSAAIASATAAGIGSALAHVLAARAERRNRERAYAGRLPPAAYAVDGGGRPDSGLDPAAFAGERMATILVVRATRAHEVEAAERLGRLCDFHGAVRDLAFAWGGALVGSAGDSAAFCFSDVFSPRGRDHGAAACQAALEISESAPLGAVGGLDTGLCLIGPAGPPGTVALTASGEAVDMALSAAGLNSRCGTRVLATEEAVKAAGLSPEAGTDQRGLPPTGTDPEATGTDPTGTDPEATTGTDPEAPTSLHTAFRAKALLRFRLAASGRSAMLYSLSREGPGSR